MFALIASFTDRTSRIFRALGLSLLVLMVPAVTACAAATDARPAASESVKVVTASGKSHVFKVEIADDEPEREQGLMNRESLARDTGMLFQFEDMAVRSFWMRNTLIPLDILYLDDKGRIVSIARNAKPLDETPLSSIIPAKGVLEINGGQAAELGIMPGDTVRHPFFGNAH